MSSVEPGDKTEGREWRFDVSDAHNTSFMDTSYHFEPVLVTLLDSWFHDNPLLICNHMKPFLFEWILALKCHLGTSLVSPSAKQCWAAIAGQGRLSLNDFIDYEGEASKNPPQAFTCYAILSRLGFASQHSQATGYLYDFGMVLVKKEIGTTREPQMWNQF